MRQYIKQNYGVNAGEALYCVMDSLYFTNHTLLETAERFHIMGGKHLFLDEVHKYEGWSREIKNIYDSLPELKVVFTGSSLLNILNAEADLSRRCASYEMQGLSFREYLLFRHNIKLPVFSLEDILVHPLEASEEVMRECFPLQHFPQYLQQGYYPFFLQKNMDYLSNVKKIK
jgi:predicted AAA+ superfamily ATPase